MELENKEELKSMGVTRLLKNLKGKLVKISFYEDEEEYDMLGAKCRIIDFHGNWLEVEYSTKKECKTKIISVASILGVEILSEN